jgi:hypothetical protein
MVTGVYEENLTFDSRHEALVEWAFWVDSGCSSVLMMMIR